MKTLKPRTLAPLLLAMGLPLAALGAPEAKPKTVIKSSVITVPYLGLASTALPTELRRQMNLPQDVGLLVRFIQPESAAAKAGLQQHDILYKFDGQILVNHHQLRTLIRMKKPGAKVAVDIYRQGKAQKLEVALGAKEMRINDRLQPIGDAKGGVKMQPIPPLDLKNQKAWIFPGDQRKHLEMLRENMIKSGMPADQVDRIIEHQTKMFERLNNMQWHRLHEGNDGQLRLELQPGQKGQLNLNFKNQSTMSYSDGEHNLTITVQDAHKNLVVKDRSGGILFDGPINTDEQRQAIPEEIRKKLDRLEKQVKVEIRTNRKPAQPKTEPDKNRTKL